MVLKDTLLYLAHNRNLRDFVTHNSATRGISRRFVAGEELDEAIEVTRVLNGQRLQAALDHLGENVFEAEQARGAVQDYIAAIERIKQTGVDANISIKLTALGLDISQELCEQNVRSILEYARQYAIFVCIDMEGSDYTEQTVDIEQLIAQGVRVRLVKGAYKEPKEISFQQKSEVDRNYVRLTMMLLSRGNFPAIATHDEAIINAACKYARDNGISKSAFEFQMLYGIRRDLQEKLVSQGYKVRIYVPYGSQWYPYLMRRLAERPADLIFVLSNALR